MVYSLTILAMDYGPWTMDYGLSTICNLECNLLLLHSPPNGLT
jgi:hypothetical protein